jgi:hypothetical protein
MAEQTMSLNYCDVEMVVVYEYEYDGGYWKDSNGDGTPPSCTLEIVGIYVNEIDMYELFLTYAPKLITSIEESILENTL